MHPFQFSRSMVFACADPDSSFVFDPSRDHFFHWYGAELDKIGRYVVIENENLYIELEWNYGREQTYTIISFEGYGDDMTAFVLKNNTTNEVYKFSK